MEIGIIITLAIALAGAILWSVKLAVDRRHIAAQRDELAARSEQLAIDLANAQSAAAQLDKDLAVLRQMHADDERRLTEFKSLIDQNLKSLTTDALRQSSEQFLQLAQQKFGAERQQAAADLEQRKQAIEALLKPVQATLDKYNTSIQAIENARQAAYGSITQMLQSMQLDQQNLRKETGNLVTALRRPEVRGRWGEIQLKRVVELAGMIDHCDFEMQSTVQSTGGTLRPDMIVRLPTDRTIVVDAKTPLDQYLQAIESVDEAQRLSHLNEHARQIKDKVDQLSRKEYAQQFQRAPDFVVLFIPGEAFLQAAVMQRPTLIEEAMERNVVIATPGTLMSLLRAVALGWREERLAENAAAISQQGRTLHERLCVFAGHLAKIGSSLKSAGDAYDSAIGSLDRNVVPAVRKLEELHAKSSSDWPDDKKLAEIHITPRESKSLPVTPEGSP